MSETDVGLRLRSMLMLGHWVQQRADLDRAVAKVGEEMKTGNLQHTLWAHHFGEALTESIPEIIQQAGIRPAQAVAQMIRTAVLFGIEVGQVLERDKWQARE